MSPREEARRAASYLASLEHADAPAGAFADLAAIDPESLVTVGADLVADLFHLCNEVGVDPESLVDAARGYHQAEGAA